MQKTQFSHQVLVLVEAFQNRVFFLEIVETISSHTSDHQDRLPHPPPKKKAPTQICLEIDLPNRITNGR